MTSLLLKYRKPLIILIHGLLFAIGYMLAFGLRFDFDLPDSSLQLMLISLPLVVLAKLIVFELFNLYQGWWRFVSMRDLITIIKASGLSALMVMAMGHLLFAGLSFPRSISVLDFVLTVVFVGGTRFLVRAIREGQIISIMHLNPNAKRVLIIGAGNAGETLAREIIKYPEMNCHIVGFLDDSPFKRRIRIHGYQVLGRIEDVRDIVTTFEVDEIFIAIPTASGPQMKQIVGLCDETGCTIKTIPGLDQLIDSRITVTMLREVQIEDLLGRAPVELDKAAVGSYLQGKKVLVTGAAGSIGSEMCRQVLAFNPCELILLDQWENGIFEMCRELSASAVSSRITYFVGDITDADRLRCIVNQARPEVVFHAAAYKHVPIMEDNPGEAVKNNVGGTRTLADICEEAGCVDRFVMISTDKAINPTSVMGASKRIAERYVQFLAQTARTRFITVRFGNVLGSAGSVVPIFKSQIAKGGPVTVTHPDMIRYFMTIPEASQLVLQAGSMGKGGEIFVLNMGEPVKIVDLAISLIKLSGLKPHEDISIEFTGIRPGEKLYEELCLNEENVTSTAHSKVFIHKAVTTYPRNFPDMIDALVNAADASSTSEIKNGIQELVSEYKCEGSVTGNKVVHLDQNKEKSKSVAPQMFSNPGPHA